MPRTGSKLSHFHHSETLQWISGPCKEWSAFLYQRKWPCSRSRWENARQPVFHVSSLLVSREFLIVLERVQLPDELIEPASFIDGETVAWNREGVECITMKMLITELGVSTMSCLVQSDSCVLSLILLASWEAWACANTKFFLLLKFHSEPAVQVYRHLIFQRHEGPKVPHLLPYLMEKLITRV